MSKQEHLDQVNEIIEVLKTLTEEETIPKNVKTKVENTIKILKEDGEMSLKINKALHELDDIGDDSNMQPYIRTQIWNIVSLLEKV